MKRRRYGQPRLTAWQEEKRLKNRYQILLKEGEKLLSKIEGVDLEIEKLIALMALEENYSDRDKIVPLLANKEKFERERHLLEDEWFKCHSEAVELEELYGF